jgi:hypothetical protein
LSSSSYSALESRSVNLPSRQAAFFETSWFPTKSAYFILKCDSSTLSNQRSSVEAFNLYYTLHVVLFLSQNPRDLILQFGESRPRRALLSGDVAVAPADDAFTKLTAATRVASKQEFDSRKKKKSLKWLLSNIQTFLRGKHLLDRGHTRL